MNSIRYNFVGPIHFEFSQNQILLVLFAFFTSTVYLVFNIAKSLKFQSSPHKKLIEKSRTSAVQKLHEKKFSHIVMREEMQYTCPEEIEPLTVRVFEDAINLDPQTLQYAIHFLQKIDGKIVNYSDKQGNGLLHVAVRCKAVDLISLVAEKGILNTKNKRNKYPMDLVVQCEDKIARHKMYIELLDAKLVKSHHTEAELTRIVSQIN